MDRRNFLFNAAAGSAGVALLPSLLTNCSTIRDPLYDVGIITNMVEKMIAKDHRKTMALLADMGYRYLEFGGTFGERPAELLAFMKDIGLIPLIGSTPINSLIDGTLQENIDAALEMEKKYLVCYWPWVGDPGDPTREMVDFAVDQMQRIGEHCRENGLRFAFHNHHQEFQVLDDQVIYEYFLKNTDPELVTMEIDLYWAYKGGADLGYYFETYPGRFEIVHVKDSYDSEDLRSFICVGSGVIDFPKLLSYREKAGFRHLVVEHDPPVENEEECARSSIEYLHSLRF